jgi:hypothetical protein
VGQDIGVLDLNGAIGGGRSEEGSDDASGLVGAAHVRVADVEEDHRVDPCAHARPRTCALKHRLLATCHRRSRHFLVVPARSVIFSFPFFYFVLMNLSSRLEMPPPSRKERRVRF